MKEVPVKSTVAKQMSLLKDPGVLLWIFLALVASEAVSAVVEDYTGYEIKVSEDKTIVECVERALDSNIDNCSIKSTIEVCFPKE